MSLVETMVGLTLGLVVALVMTQVWSSFENQKQRSVSGSTAQESGLLALTQIEQDGRNAGANLVNDSAVECTTTYAYYESGGTQYSPPAHTGGVNAPVRIISGGNAGSDTIIFKRGGDPTGGVPVTLQVNMSSSSAVIDMPSVAGFNDGDIAMLMGPGGQCTVLQITQVMVAAGKVQHNPGGSTTWNPPTSYRNSNGWPAYNAGSKIMKIGRVEMRTYSVNANNELRVQDDTDPANVTQTTLAYDIVRLKAQYGIAAAGSQDVTAWVNATAATGWDVLDADEIKRIKAVRVAVVARSPKLEGANITANCAYNNATGPCAWADVAGSPAPIVDLSANANWRRYRYRVYETIIPLRNVIWANL